MSGWVIRPAVDGDRPSILRIWHQGWHDAHGHLVPDEILAYRKPDHFRLWLDDVIDDTWVAENSASLIGFYALEGDELSKLYVGKSARGSGVAQALLAHAERTLIAAGIDTARLCCTAGNQHAQRFYERHGWRMTETFMDALWCPDADADTHLIATHRYAKDL